MHCARSVCVRPAYITCHRADIDHNTELSSSIDHAGLGITNTATLFLFSVDRLVFIGMPIEHLSSCIKCTDVFTLTSILCCQLHRFFAKDMTYYNCFKLSVFCLISST